MHPLQTFPDPAAGIARIPGSLIALEADDDEGSFIAERIAEDLMGVPFRLAGEHRALYHAAAVFASNYVVSATAVAEQLLAAAGVPDPAAAMRPLQEATIENVASMGPAAALTGPAARGDAGTIERNLEALAQDLPWAVAPYVEMARVALDVAERGWPAGSGTPRGGGGGADALDVIGSPTDLRARTDASRAAGATVGLVPTMGALHEGHASLIERTRAARDLVVVSIFVNPLQFDDPQDLSRYPEDRERDLERCRDLGVDVVWAPSVEQMYPPGADLASPQPGPVGDSFEGAARPGHFAGVLKAVHRLFDVTGPCGAAFGQKDAQQLFLVRRMVVRGRPARADPGLPHGPRA